MCSALQKKLHRAVRKDNMSFPGIVTVVIAFYLMYFSNIYLKWLKTPLLTPLLLVCVLLPPFPLVHSPPRSLSLSPHLLWLLCVLCCWSLATLGQMQMNKSSVIQEEVSYSFLSLPQTAHSSRNVTTRQAMEKNSLFY